MSLDALRFCPELYDLYAAKEVKGETGKLCDRGGLSTVNNIVRLRQLMLEQQPARTLEIGMACGGSALTFAASHRDLGRAPNQQHTSIDAAQQNVWDNIALRYLDMAHLKGYVEVIEGCSAYTLPQLVSQSRRYGLIYIDGSHQFEDVLIDFVFCHELLEVSGVILFDDSTDSHVAKVLRFIEANYVGVYQRNRLPAISRRSRIKDAVATAMRKNQLTAYRKLQDGRLNWGKPLNRF